MRAPQPEARTGHRRRSPYTACPSISEGPMDLTRLITLVRAHLWLILGSTVLAVVAAYGVTSVTPKTYEATARVVVGPGINGKVQDYNQLLSSLQLARTYAAAATTGIMADQVIGALSLDMTADEFLKTISVETARD